MDGNTQQSTWSRRLWAREAQWRGIVILVGLAAISIQGIRIASEARGDFRNHWELGRRFAQGEFIYFADGTLEQPPDATTPRRPKDHPYPPFWAFVHAPLTLLPKNFAQLAIFPLFAISLVSLFWILSRLTEKSLPADRRSTFWIAVAAIALASRFVIRDMPECGVNLALVTLSWLAVYMWTRRREIFAGTALGLAIALKCTPALFLAYFLWKRQWKMVAATSAAAALFTLSPVLAMGPARYGETMRFWIAHAWEGFGNPDPSVGVLGPERIQNLSLRPALARFLMHLPEGHLSRFDHRLYFDAFDLPPATAGIVARLILIALVGRVAWMLRGTVIRRDDLCICWECATVSILMLLLSPITWGQHCVALLPALYLFTRSHHVAGPHPKWMYWTMGLYVALILVLNRTLFGKDLTWLLDSYRLPTWFLLAFVAMAVACHRRSGDLSAETQRIRNPTQTSERRQAA